MLRNKLKLSPICRKSYEKIKCVKTPAIFVTNGRLKSSKWAPKSLSVKTNRPSSLARFHFFFGMHMLNEFSRERFYRLSYLFIFTTLMRLYRLSCPLNDFLLLMSFSLGNLKSRYLLPLMTHAVLSTLVRWQVQNSIFFWSADLHELSKSRALSMDKKATIL